MNKVTESRELLTDIYNKYGNDLYVLAYSILKDKTEAEDMLQTIIIKIANNIDKVKEIKDEKLKAYLCTMMRNACLDFLKKQKQIVVLSLYEEMIESEDEIYKDILEIEERQEIARYIIKLNASYKEIIYLRYYEELTIKEISVLLNINENNVSVRINRAIKALRKEINKCKGGVNYGKAK